MAIDHIEEISLAVSIAVRILLALGNAAKIEQNSEHAKITAYFVNEIIRIDVRPRNG